MIAIKSEAGELLKVFPQAAGQTIGFHPVFGLVSEKGLAERMRRRGRAGFTAASQDFQFSFQLAGHEFIEGQGCRAEKHGEVWTVQTPAGHLQIAPYADEYKADTESTKGVRGTLWAVASLAFFALALLVLYWPGGPEKADAPQVVEQVTVPIKAAVQPKPVEIKSVLDRIPEVAKQAPEAKRAINQKLGFLGLLGRKDLSKAIGGAPTELKDASAGAGRGTQGSGGEYLVGMGEGLKRATVGNTGVVGLGGVGTKGAGGGKGGYGNTEIGSGDGGKLSALPLSDEVELEGGLDRAVVQATIAKYLSQVRACYEQGLKSDPSITGEVAMAFTITGAGLVLAPHVQRSSLGSPEVEKCISTRMLTWNFPRPRGGVSVKVTYPFLLRSAGLQ